MRKVLFGVGVAAMMALTVGGGMSEAQTAPQAISTKTVIGWQWGGMNADGTPCTDLAGFRVGIWSGQDAAEAPVQSKIAAPEARQSAIAELVAAMPQGAEVIIKVLAFDLAGNESIWSQDEVRGTVDKVPPAAPGGCAILR